MKKNKTILGIIAIISACTLASCKNPTTIINNYLPEEIKVETTESDIAAKFSADRVLQQLGTFTDCYNEKSIVETHLEKQYIKNFNIEDPDPIKNFTDLTLTYPMNITECIKKVQKNPELSGSIRPTTYYAKFNVNNSTLQVKTGKYGEQELQTYYYMVLPDSKDEASPNGFDIYIAKKDGGKAIAMISKITNETNIAFEYSTLKTSKTTTTVKTFKQFKSKEIYSDYIDMLFAKKTAPSVEEAKKIEEEKTLFLSNKYPDYQELVIVKNDIESFLLNSDFPNPYTISVWQNKKKIADEFDIKKDTVNTIFNNFHTRSNTTKQNFIGKLNNLLVTYTTDNIPDAGCDSLSITTIGNYKLKFQALTSFINQFFNDNWYYEYSNGKVTAKLTDKGIANNSADSIFTEGDYVTLKLISSDCKKETLPKSIIISAEISKLKNNAESPIKNIPEITLTRENFTASELNDFFAKYKKWNIQASKSQNIVPEGVIEFINVPCKDNIWNIEDSDKNIYVTSTLKAEQDWYYVNETNSPIIFTNNIDGEKFPVVKTTITLGNLKSNPELNLPTADHTNSMINMNNYVVADATIKDGKIILTGAIDDLSYPRTLTLIPAK